MAESEHIVGEGESSRREEARKEDAASQGAQPVDGTPTFEVAGQPSYVRTVFFGADGLKAGWGLAFYVAIFYPLQFVAVHWAVSLDIDRSGLWAMMLEEIAVFAAAAVPAVILAMVERRPWGAYGLPLRQAFGKFFWRGVVWGLVSVTALMGALYGLKAFQVASLAIHGARLAKFAVFWAIFFLVVGLFEEFLMRGYTQFTLTRITGFWRSAIFLSCIFGLIHSQNSGEQWPGLVAAAFIGLFFCLTLRRTGTLWFAVGFHAAWDWGETFVYSVPDSGNLFPGHLLKSSFHGPAWLTGGMVGPEGSVLCFVVVAATWAAFAKAYPEVRYAGVTK